MALTDNLIAYWKLDESSGNAADSVGSLTLTNNNTVSFSSGLINNGADLGASNSSKNFSNASASVIGNGSISVSAWIKPTANPTSDSDPTPASRFNIFGASASSVGISYFLHVSNVSGTVKVIFGRWRNSVAINFAEYTYTPPTSSWTHVVGTYDGTTVKVYVNNNTPGTTTSSGNGSGGPDGTAIGSNNSSQAYFSGMIDEVGLWSRAITSTEVGEIYNGGAGKQWPFISYISKHFFKLVTEIA